MTAMLPRLKPSPIPSINPIPEYLADERLRAVYEDTKSTLQVPWMGVVTMAFAHYPNFYGILWNGMRELAASSEFITACRTLRSTAEEEAANLGVNNIAPELQALGYADRELDEIRDQIEIFSHGNMPYLLIASTARLLLEGMELSDHRQISPFDESHGPSAYGRLVLIEPHHADVPTQNVYEDIKSTLGLPFVNTDYRALARWPSYFALAWNDLRGHIDTESYHAALISVHGTAIDLIQALPNPSDLNSRQLCAAAAEDSSIEEVTEVVRFFQWLLPGLAVNVAHFRQQLK